jgi:selenophosphate synthetase-related protein
MVEMTERGLANAARDVSGPGIIGTIAMLCESSRVGAIVNLENVPKPEVVKLEEWLITYPGIGFVVSTNQQEECLEVFKKHKLTAATVGEITSNKEIWLSDKEENALFLDLKRESIFGVKRLQENSH